MTWRYVEARDTDAPLPRRILGLWRHRRLLRRMAERDLRQRYAGSTIGYLWAAVSPLLFVALYTAIFTTVFRGRLSPGGPPQEYALYVVSGLLPWVVFTEVASRATQVMAEHRSLVKFAVFPIQVLPLTALYTVAFSQAAGLIALIALAAWSAGGLPPALPLLAPALVLQAVFLAGVCWLLGAAGALLRDVREVITIALTAGMFLTPIFFTDADTPRLLRPVIELNPLTHLIRLYRDALLGGSLHVASLAVFAVVALVTFVAGYVAFERARVFLSDVL
jgi:lipopolysaccharide transport system permease protein